MFKYGLALIFLVTTFFNNPVFSQDGPELPSEAKKQQQEKPCRTPFIKEMIPRSAATGANVIIVGFGFGSSPGEVLFQNSVKAPITSWQPQRIVVTVPEGIQDGHVTVINSCSARSKDEAGGYFKILQGH